MTALARGRPPFRADHIGSLLRPVALRQAFKQHATGQLDDVAFERLQDDCIRSVVRLQESAGLEVVTDGEFRRGSFWGRFVEGIEGFDIRDAIFKFRDAQGNETEFNTPYASAPLRRRRPLVLDEFVFLRDTTRVTPKVTMPSPSTMHFHRCSDYADKNVYKDTRHFFDDLCRVYREEVCALADAGCRYIQFDEVPIALLCDPAIRGQVESLGLNSDDLVDLYIDALNSAFADAPSDMIAAVHMCRGNFKGRYLSEGSYESIAERFFSRAKVNHFLLEFDTPRAGDFSPLRFVPKGKGVVLGLVSSKFPILEDPDLLKRRIEEAAEFIELERLAISPQCGFASTVAGNPLTEEAERAKLELIVRTARSVWS
ncbi:MAG: 5-methyltetrahydropteroyltriglutamate--homocysteine S-methyltransferase [Pseudorhodoplanes sp.]|uniref:5-methyltetrahydropteroyltriglutamate-- homocysteine S-methyltransferase n=1 Tax=Pseudorhodoplanes sp. TaxID=1934341 RepID=UPI003D0BFD5A